MALTNDKQSSPSQANYRVFISYTKEDEELGGLLAKRMRDTFKRRPFEVLTMKDFKAGREWRKDLRVFLNETDLLITIFTGQQKDSHSWTGWEVGFFAAKAEERDSRFPSAAEKIPRLIVPINFLGRTSAATDDRQAVKIEFTPELDKSLNPENVKHANISIGDLLIIRDEFAKHFVVPEEDPLFQLLKTIGGYLSILEAKPQTADDEREFKDAAKKYYFEVHEELRNRPDGGDTLETKLVITLGSQHKLDTYPVSIDDGTIELLSAKDSIFKPDGDVSEFTWKEFWTHIESKNTADAALIWSTTLIDLLRSTEGEAELDRAQTLVSADGAKLYRAIVTRRVTFYGGRREFHVYIFQALKRRDYGDAETSFLMRAILVACRYRFMLLEPTSDFRPEIFEGADRDSFRMNLIKMLNELDRILQESAEAGLYVTKNQLAMYPSAAAKNSADDVFRKAETKMREKAVACLKMAIKSEDDFKAARDGFVKIYQNFCSATREINRDFLLEGLRQLDAKIHELERRAQPTATIAQGS